MDFDEIDLHVPRRMNPTDVGDSLNFSSCMAMMSSVLFLTF